MLSHLTHGGLGGCDGIDSELDKDGKKKQSVSFFIDSPFGAAIGCCRNDRNEAVAIIKKHACKLSADPLETRNQLLKELEPLYSITLGETRFPCNDVTLWAHSYSVASLTKALFAKVLLERESLREDLPYKLPRRLREEDSCEGMNSTDFTFMKITVDRDYLWSTAQKAGDVMGIAEQVLQLQDVVRKHVETTVLVGNEVYRDQERQLFLVPRLGTWLDDHGHNVLSDTLQQDFECELGASIKDCILEWMRVNNCLEMPFDIRFALCGADDGVIITKRILSRSAALLNTNNPCAQALPGATQHGAGKERCGVCGVRLVDNAEEKRKEHVCNCCYKRRHKRSVTNRRNRGPITSDLETLIPVGNSENRLALIYLAFNLDALNTGDVFEKVRWEIRNKDNETVEVKKNPSPGRLYRSWESLALFLQYCRDEIAIPCCNEGVENALFPVTLAPTPDRMEFIIRGAKAGEVMTAIYEEYEQRFGKFRECLPFSIGCIFFYRKFPLYVVMDAARGMREAFAVPRVTRYTIKHIGNCDDGRKQILLKEDVPDAPGALASWTEWRVHPMLSNGAGPDIYHARFSGRHVNDLTEGIIIPVTEGRFDFILADSAQTRNAFSSAGRAHHILGKRPSYPVGAVRDFDRLWKLLTKLNTNQASALETLLVEKMQIWGARWWEDPEAARAFCRLVLFSPNAFGKRRKNGTYALLDADSNLPELPENCDKAVLERAAYNGLLLDVLDFYKHLQNA